MSKATAKLLVIGPAVPPIGGMSIFFENLRHNLVKDAVFSADFLPTNVADRLPIIGSIPLLRTLASLGLFVARLSVLLRNAGIVFLMGASNEYFFLRVFPVLLLAKIFGRKIILNYHGGGLEQFVKTSRLPVLRLLRMADLIAVPNQYLQDTFSKYGIGAAILSNFIDCNTFAYRPPQAACLRLICTRNLEPIYNQQMILRAVSILQQEGIAVTLTLIGSGMLRTELEQHVKSLDLKDVCFAGKIENHNLPAVLAQHDVYLNCSRSDNFPLSLVEAMAVGLPVISTAVGGIPCLITDGENGFLVPSDNAALLAAAVKKLQDPLLASTISTAGRKTAERYTWDAVRESYHAILKECHDASTTDKKRTASRS